MSSRETKPIQIVAGAASSYAAAGYFTVIDGIVIPGWFLEPLWKSFTDLGEFESNALDVGDLSPAGVADQLERSLRQGHLAI